MEGAFRLKFTILTCCGSVNLYAMLGMDYKQKKDDAPVQASGEKNRTVRGDAVMRHA